MTTEAHQEKKRVRRPNVVYSFTSPPDQVKDFHVCQEHELYSLHRCPKCVVAKREATMIERHGVRSALCSQEIMDKKKDTCIERYQTEVPSKSEKIKEKIKESNLARYGVEHTLQVKEIRQKGTTTMIEKYGVEHAFQNKDILAKRVDTYVERYGVENPLQNVDVLNKRKKTNVERYGTEEVLKSKGVQEKIQTTMMEKYNVSNPLQNPEIMARKNATCEELYGNSVIMHVPSLFEKKTVNSFSHKKLTLPSGKAIHYQGYEDVAIRELLKNHLEEDIVNDVKTMPECKYTWKGKKCRYYPDIYIPKEKKIIEVKSPYTYLSQRAQNQAKRACVVEMGYTFEFWICDKNSVLYKTGGWERDEDVPWYVVPKKQDDDTKVDDS